MSTGLPLPPSTELRPLALQPLTELTPVRPLTYEQHEEEPGILTLESTVSLCVDQHNVPLYGYMRDGSYTAVHPDDCDPVRAVDIALTIWYVVLLVAMVILNGRIVHKLWGQRNRRRRELKRRIDTLVGVLCLSDVFMILPITLTTFSMGYGRSKFYADFYPQDISTSSPNICVMTWCNISSFLFGLSSQLSVLIIMFISLLRLISVCFPIQAPVILSSRTSITCLVLSVLVVIGLAVEPYVSLKVIYMKNEGLCVHRLDNTSSPTTAVFLTSTVPFVVPIAVSILCLLGIIIKMKELKRIKLNSNADKQLYSIMIVALQVISVFVFCFFPWMVDGFAFLLNQRGSKTLYGRLVCSSCGSIMYVRHIFKAFLIYFNCLVNPFLYGRLIDIGEERMSRPGSTASTSITRAVSFSACAINTIRDKLKYETKLQ